MKDEDQVDVVDTNHKLKRPIKVGDKTIEMVVLSEPPASKLRGVKLSLPARKDVATIELDIDTSLTVVGLCCLELLPPEVEKMSIVDVNDIYWKCIQLFFG